MSNDTDNVVHSEISDYDQARFDLEVARADAFDVASEMADALEKQYGNSGDPHTGPSCLKWRLMRAFSQHGMLSRRVDRLQRVEEKAESEACPGHCYSCSNPEDHDCVVG